MDFQDWDWDWDLGPFLMKRHATSSCICVGPDWPHFGQTPDPNPNPIPILGLGLDRIEFALSLSKKIIPILRLE